MNPNSEAYEDLARASRSGKIKRKKARTFRSVGFCGYPSRVVPFFSRETKNNATIFFGSLTKGTPIVVFCFFTQAKTHVVSVFKVIFCKTFDSLGTR